MNILEKDLEEIIEKTPVKKLNEKGLFVFGKCKRQLRIGNYGILDLVFIQKRYEYNDDGTMTPYLLINICELKKEKAGISAFLQAIRYAKGIKQYLVKVRGFTRFKMEITLIAPKIDTSSDYVFIGDLIGGDSLLCVSEVNNYAVNYGFEGVTFKQERNYSLTETGF